ncbi:MAG TPA: outer membrane beta-barrel protein [Balneolaceae bacterium]|nr:outer membrane beta-barrel protein [Balneolaceae bacterium]
MNIKKLLLASVTLALLMGTVPQAAAAQWSIGASYQIREEAPENGFGIRLERELLGAAPVLNLALQAHFSYFSADNYLGANDITYGEVENYDYGIAALGGVSLGLISPYIGLGLGSTTFELGDEADLPGEGSDSSLYWNGFIGAKISPIPVVKPFVEYRIQSTQEFEDLGESDMGNGRLIFGIYIAF